MQNTTIVNFYNLSQGGYTKPNPKTIQNPISVIVSKRGRGISDAEVTLSETQYKAISPNVFGLFEVENIDLVFVITEIRQTTDNSALTFTLIASEITAWYMSRRSCTKDRVAETTTTPLTDFLVLCLNNLLPVGVNASKASETPNYYTTDSNKVMAVQVADNTSSVVTKILHEGDTLQDWILSELENSNKYLDIKSVINTNYYNGTDYAVLIYALISINDATTTRVYNLQGDIETKEKGDVLYQQTLKAWGPQGAGLGEDTATRETDVSNSTQNTTQEIQATNVTEFFCGIYDNYKPVMAGATNKISAGGLKAMTWDAFVNYMTKAIGVDNQPNLICNDYAQYNKPSNIEISGTKILLYYEQQEITITPGSESFVDASGNRHAGLGVLCGSTGLFNLITDFYTNLGLGIHIEDMGLTPVGQHIFHRLGIWREGGKNIPIALCNITQNGGMTSPPLLRKDWAKYRSFDVTENLDYCFPLALCAYEYMLATQLGNRLTTNITASEDDALDGNNTLTMGSAVAISIGVAKKTGFVSSVTETRENGETTRDYEIEWLQNE